MLHKYISGSYLINNDIVDNVYSVGKVDNGCETALLRLYNDIMTIGRGNGAMLVLLDLSAAFDTIDPDNLFCILEKYVGIMKYSKTNQVIFFKSYLLNVFNLLMFLSDFASIICGVPHSSVLGHLKLYFYFLPLIVTLKVS